MALNRHCWKEAVKEGSARYERELHRVTETKRQLRKERQKRMTTTHQHFHMPTLHQNMWVTDRPLHPPKDPQVDNPTKKTVILAPSDC